MTFREELVSIVLNVVYYGVGRFYTDTNTKQYEIIGFTREIHFLEERQMQRLFYLKVVFVRDETV